MITFILCVAAASVIGFVVGYLCKGDESIQRMEKSHLNFLNDFMKQTSKREVVAEFIAPGEHAEVVLIADGIDPVCSNLHLTREDCQGCRYAGRYLIPS